MGLKAISSIAPSSQNQKNEKKSWRKGEEKGKRKNTESLWAIMNAPSLIFLSLGGFLFFRFMPKTQKQKINNLIAFLYFYLFNKTEIGLKKRYSAHENMTVEYWQKDFDDFISPKERQDPFKEKRKIKEKIRKLIRKTGRYILIRFLSHWPCKC